MSTSLARPRTAAVALTLVLALAATAAVTALLALAALALGADPAFAPLSPGAYLTFGLAGVILGIAGWVVVVRLVRRSARMLRILVPAVLAATLVPDVVLLATGFLPGTTPIGVVALMLMHVAVAAIAALAARRIAPAR